MISIKQKIYIIAGCSFGALAALAFFVVVPLAAKTRDYSGELSLQESTLSALQQQLSGVRDFQENEEIYQTYLNQIDSFYVTPDAPIDFMEFLEAEAAREGLELEVGASGVQEGEFSLSFQIKLEGPFVNALRFLERLEQGPWLIEPGSLTVSRIGQGGSGAEAGLSQAVIFSIGLSALAKAQ